MKRYAAKLLFQYRVTVGGEDNKRRMCEETIIVIKAVSARKALALAKKRGKEKQHDYMNGDGNPVHFEFVGILELLGLDPECEPDEVWYDMRLRILPLERKASLIPRESSLNAIQVDV